MDVAAALVGVDHRATAWAVIVVEVETWHVCKFEELI